MAKLQKGVNDLKTWCLNNGDFGQQLMQEWTGECENGLVYSIDKVARASNKKFKWRCDRGHEWYAKVLHRTYCMSGCSYCSGKIVSDKNSLKNWCLTHGDFGQQLLNEWAGDCDDGKHYEINDVSFGSNKKFKWKCSEGHEWFAFISNRVIGKTACPTCSKALVSSKILEACLQKGVNDLKTWCLDNGDFGQQVLKEWTGQCEDGKCYGIDGVARASRKKFKWRCSEGHEWFMVLWCRTGQKQGCPYCSGQRVSDKNSLKNWCLNNGDFGKQLLKEWTGDCDDGKHYEIDEVAKASAKKFKWKCSKGHEWFAAINDRTKQKQCCPYCSGHRVSDKNSLQSWCLNNGDFGQQLLKEWTGECEDGKHYEIDEISFGSNKKFKWRCSEGHEWFAFVRQTYENYLKHMSPEVV